jgi:hypothetical protein
LSRSGELDLAETQLLLSALGALSSPAAIALRAAVDLAAAHGVANVESTLRPVLLRWSERRA